MLHSALTVPLGNHVIQSWEVADAAALAALTPILADIGRIAYQVDTKEFHVLTNNTGPVWGKMPLELAGTWVPTIYGDTTAGANTYSRQTGFYRKHGSIVQAQGRVTLATKDAAMAGNVRITLPFTPLSTAESHGPADVGFHQNITYPAGKTALIAIVLAGGAISLRWPMSAGGIASVVPADLSATTDIIFGATYISNA